MTIYFMLPPNELNTYYRFARLIVQACINSLSVEPKTGDRRVLLLLDEQAQLKSMESIVNAIALLRGYMDGHRPALPHASAVWLFPGQASPDAPRHKGSFGQAITGAIEQYVGIRLNPHAFRAFAGAIILEADPHAIDDVRAILGHRCFETAMIYYRRSSQRAAANRLSATLARERRATKLSASAHFLAPDLRRRARRA
jgi:hypothetical protein